jgi:bifunctional DNA-binding transcriptional regulator/antitoxin component of YhaV-PrlF toxin-antitoxin module
MFGETAVKTATTKIVDGGRLILPAEFRRALNLQKGDSVTLQLEGNEVRMRSTREVVRQIQYKMKKYEIEGSIVDDLIAERRREARMEDEGR